MFAVFAGSQYYPAGGWSDFKDTFDTPEEAMEFIANLNCDWWQIVDLHAERIVGSGYRK